VTATTSSGLANSSSQLLSAEPPGLNRDRFLPVRHSSYIWTLCTLDTESGADPQKLDKKSSIFWDVTPCSPVESQPPFRRDMSPPSSGSKNKLRNRRE
jgi:hypothetical protein